MFKQSQDILIHDDYSPIKAFKFSARGSVPNIYSQDVSPRKQTALHFGSNSSFDIIQKAQQNSYRAKISNLKAPRASSNSECLPRNIYDLSHRGQNPSKIGWGVQSLRDPLQKDSSREIKSFMRGFDEKKTQQFIYQQDGFSATLDKKIGFQYSDKFSIRQMREEIMSIMKKANKTGKYSQYQTQRNNKKVMYRDESIMHLDSQMATPEMYINNSFTPVMVGGDYEKDRIIKQKKNDIPRLSLNSGLTTNIGETSAIPDTTVDLNSASSILLGTYDENRGKKYKKDFASCKHLLNTHNSRKSNISNMSAKSNRLHEYKMIVESSHCPRFRRMRAENDNSSRYQSVLINAGQSSFTPYTQLGSIDNFTPVIPKKKKKIHQFMDLHDIVAEHPVDQEQTFQVDRIKEQSIN